MRMIQEGDIFKENVDVYDHFKANGYRTGGFLDKSILEENIEHFELIK